MPFIYSAVHFAISDGGLKEKVKPKEMTVLALVGAIFSHRHITSNSVSVIFKDNPTI